MYAVEEGKEEEEEEEEGRLAANFQPARALKNTNTSCSGQLVFVFFNARAGWKLAAKRPTAKIRGPVWR